MGKCGRPSRPPTSDERKKVAELVASKAPIGDIAKLLSRSVPNVRKYFSRELSFAKKKPSPAELPFKITKVHRDKVVRYIGCKMQPEQVARVLGLTLDQLKEAFPEEIATGAAKCRAKVIDNLHEQMEAGLVGATNRLEAMTAIPEEANPAPGAHLGKKAAANAAAQATVAAGSKFSPRPPPRLVVNNGESVS